MHHQQQQQQQQQQQLYQQHKLTQHSKLVLSIYFTLCLSTPSPAKRVYNFLCTTLTNLDTVW